MVDFFFPWSTRVNIWYGGVNRQTSEGRPPCAVYLIRWRLASARRKLRLSGALGGPGAQPRAKSSLQLPPEGRRRQCLADLSFLPSLSRASSPSRISSPLTPRHPPSSLRSFFFFFLIYICCITIDKIRTLRKIAPLKRDLQTKTYRKSNLILQRICFCIVYVFTKIAIQLLTLL